MIGLHVALRRAPVPEQLSLKVLQKISNCSVHGILVRPGVQLVAFRYRLSMVVSIVGSEVSRLVF